MAVGAGALAFTSDHEDDPLPVLSIAIPVGLTFVGAGLYAWHRRPENRTGPLMALVGYTWFFGGLLESDNAWLFTAGLVLGTANFAFLVWLVLAYPTGRLETRLNRALVAAAFVLTIGGSLLLSLFEDEPISDCANCPQNALLVADYERIAGAIAAALVASSVVALLLIVLVLARRWRAASRPLRRALAHVFFTGGITMVLVCALLVADTLETGADEILYWVLLGSLLSVPIGFLLGLLRSRLARAGVSRLVVELGERTGPAELRDAIARALNDPSLEIGYWLREQNSFVDDAGRPLDPPPPGGTRTSTVVERRGRPVACLLHDSVLKDDPALLEAVTAAAGLALENERRLQALAASERRTRALLDAIPDLMFRIRRDGTYVDFEVKSEDSLATPPDQIIGRTVRERLPPNVADLLMGSIERAVDGEGVQTCEYDLVVAGRLRHFEGRVAASGGDEVLLIVREITARKEAQAALEAERDLVRTIVDTAPSVFCGVDSEGRIIRYNRTLERLSGIPDDDRTRGRLFWEVFVVPEDAEEYERQWRAGVAGDTAEHQSRFRTADGGEAVVAWTVRWYPGEGGADRYLISGMDVTVRKQQEEELRASRARLVEAGDQERRRLERNLHDGAQQRLVSLSLALRLAKSRLKASPDEADRMLELAGEELNRALEELRELARGIHPAVLTDRGLAPALEALAARSPVPVDVQTPDERLPQQVEAAAYFLVSEALANVAKYAQASSVAVNVERSDGRVVVEVSDDGVGGADPDTGSGIRGLADRVSALDGRLDVESPRGGGTRIRAEIPVAAEPASQPHLQQ